MWRGINRAERDQMRRLGKGDALDPQNSELESEIPFGALVWLSGSRKGPTLPQLRCLHIVIQELWMRWSLVLHVGDCTCIMQLLLPINKGVFPCEWRFGFDWLFDFLKHVQIYILPMSDCWTTRLQVQNESWFATSYGAEESRRKCKCKRSTGPSTTFLYASRWVRRQVSRHRRNFHYRNRLSFGAIFVHYWFTLRRFRQNVLINEVFRRNNGFGALDPSNRGSERCTYLGWIPWRSTIGSEWLAKR